MASPNVESYDFPVFPSRSTNYITRYQGFPDIFSKPTAAAPAAAAGFTAFNKTGIIIAALILALVLVSVAVILPIVLSQVRIKSESTQSTSLGTTKSGSSNSPPSTSSSSISPPSTSSSSISSSSISQTSKPVGLVSTLKLTSQPSPTTSLPVFQTSPVVPQTSPSVSQTSPIVSMTSTILSQTSPPVSQTSTSYPMTSRPTSQSSQSASQTWTSRPQLQTTSSAVSTSLSTTSTLTTTTGCPVFCVPTNQCIPASQVCDKYQDCPNDIDETNCACDSNHYPCINGRCIYKSWLCDGVKDCPLGDDESPPRCSSCNATQFLCEKPRTCISSYEQCDGMTDCGDSSDESSCLILNGTLSNDNTALVTATYKGIPGYYLCADNWNTTWSDSVCREMGQEQSQTTSYQSINGSFLILNVSASSSDFMAYLYSSNCSSNQAVKISCSKSVCGTRSVPAPSVGPYIINGIRAMRGAWPWQVQYLAGVYSGSGSFSEVARCGGILLDSRWILTAAHCNQVTYSGLGYTGTIQPSNIQIILGSLTTSGDSDTVYARVDTVFTHPMYNNSGGVIVNDVGLLRLSAPIAFTDTIRPICLPSSTENLQQFRVCVDTGFGKTIRNVISNYLLQARVTLLSYTDCYNYFKSTSVRDQTQICVGTIPTDHDINFCQGDSGGPVSCQDQNGVWTVIGINSYTIGQNDGIAADICALSVATRVTFYVDWIQQTMSANSV